MANIKITALPAYADPASTDVLPIVDVGADVTKKVSIENLLKNASSGTAGAPGIAFDGDNTGTGIYHPGSGQVAISTNGTGRLFVAADGKVGILRSPQYELDVLGSARLPNSAWIYFNNAAGNAQQVLTVFSDNSTYLDAASGGDIVFRPNASQERARLTSTGRLGLGTSSPSSLLEIRGTNADGQLTISNSSGTITTGNTLGTIFFKNYDVSVNYNTFTGNVASIAAIAESDYASSNGARAGIAFSTNDITRPSVSGGPTLVERMRLDSQGRLGVGTTSPSNALNVVGTVDIDSATSGGDFTRFRIDPGTTASDTVTLESRLVIGNSNLAFSTGPAGGTSERARIDSSGRLLVGTSSARSNFFNSSSFSGLLQIEGTGDSTRVVSQIFNRDNAGQPLFVLGKSRGTTAGSNTAVQSSDYLGTLSFQGADGTELVEAASISAVVDGPPSANDMPGRIVLSTTASGASSPTERMRISNNGVVDIGSGGVGGNLRAMISSSYKVQISNTNTATTNLVFIEFGRSASNPGTYTAEGDIRTDGSGNLAFTNASDISLKENIRDLDTCLEIVNALRPVLFDWKEDHKPCCTDIKGFIAQEFEQVLPKSVSTDDAGIKSLAPVSELLPVLVGAIKELTAQVVGLQAEVTALKAQ